MNCQTICRSMLVACLWAIAAVAPAGASDSASEAEAREPPGRDCLFASQPSRWVVLDQRHLVLWGQGSKEVFLVELFFPLSDLNFSESIGFVDGDHNGKICGDSFDKILIPGNHSINPASSIVSMKRVNEAQLLALSEQYQVKLLSKKQLEQLKSHDKQSH